MKRELIMRLIVVLVVVTFVANAFGVGGDMGLGTDPLIDGSEGHPFLIEDIGDFYRFSIGSDYWASGVHTRMETDISLAGPTFERAVIAPDTRTASNYQGISFQGVFDGNNHVVSNLTINTNGADSDYLGLFGYIQAEFIGDPNNEYAECSIKNLGLENVNIVGGSNSMYIGGLCGSGILCSINNCYVTGYVSGYRDIGGLFGYSEGCDFSQCHFDGTVTGDYRTGGLCGYTHGSHKSSINDCYSTGSVYSLEGAGGGLCGTNSSDIYNSYSSCSVRGRVMIGGLCGVNWPKTILKNNYATGDVIVMQANGGFAGGLCGANYGQIVGSYSTGPVTGDDGSSTMGGFCGFAAGNISECYSTGIVTGGDSSEYLGGFCGTGSAESPEISNCYSSSSVICGNDSTYIGGMFGASLGSIKNNYCSGLVICGSNASYVGGFCGRHYLGLISNCYSIGSIKDGDDSGDIGGFCGGNHDGTINDSFWDVNSSGMGTSGDDNFGATGKTTKQMQVESTFTGWDFIYDWWINVDYPRLSWQHTIVYDGDIFADIVRGDSCVVYIDVYSLADETLNWSISGENQCDWITGVYPHSGSSSGPTDKQTVAIYINSAGMNAGDYIFFGLTLSGDNGEVVICPVQLHAEFHGSGTSNDPYLIESLSDFDVFSNPIHGESYWSSGVHTKLTCDIDLADRVYERAVIAADYYNAITGGSEGMPFKGVFDGDGHVIRNLTIDASDTGEGFSANSCLGLFGKIESAEDLYAVVKNLGVEDANIAGGYMSYSIGGLCGNNGTWSYPYGGSMINCYSTGVVTSGDFSSAIGGLCGSNGGGNLKNCYSTVTVSSSYGSDYLGSLCGINYCGQISNCYSTGSVTGGDYISRVGGFCGGNHGEISNCYSAGAVTVDETANNVNGFCGINHQGNINDSFWDVNSSGIGTSGDDNGGATGKTTGQMQTESTFTDAGWSFYSEDPDPNWIMPINDYPKLNFEPRIAFYGDIEVFMLSGDNFVIDINVYSMVEETFGWAIAGDESCGWITSVHPAMGISSGRTDQTTVSIDIDSTGLSLGDYQCMLRIEADNGESTILPIRLHIVVMLGSGTLNDPYMIGSLAAFDLVTAASNSSVYWVSGVHMQLVSDIDLSGRTYSGAVFAPYTEPPLVPFEGVFDGCGHVIRNLTIDSNDFFVSLFGSIDGPGVEVKNLGVEDVNITVVSNNVTGGLCGVNTSGTINNCYSSGLVRGTGYSYCVGGLCGQNFGAIINCYSSSLVDCNVGGYLGGLCGANGGRIIGSYSTRSVTGGDGSYSVGGLCGLNYEGIISNCYSTGSVTGDSFVGGFCGKSYDGDMNDSFWDVNNSGMVVGYNLDTTYPGTVTNVVGKTTAEMHIESTFTDAGWDFDPGDGDIADWWVNEGRDYPKLGWQPWGDLNNDSHVDMLDVAVMGLGWFSGDGDLNFNSVCELSGDWVIDEADLLEVGVMWLAGPGW